eukprot:TRINITY_DN25675_c0_g2_i1.p1 TRINITY_DN25675_c0_g2~~TRINITY_DN25675_c0_g2_i1.p1  ORF type:complete len:980 (-),score=175.90 TRINITY_DN25675_c0_g2_i1:16-2955(-)
MSVRERPAASHKRLADRSVAMASSSRSRPPVPAASGDVEDPCGLVSRHHRRGPQALRASCLASLLLACVLVACGCGTGAGAADSAHELSFDLTSVAPALEDAEVFPEAYWRQMRWGTYRPGVYFGGKGRHKGSLLFGIAWSSANGKVFRHDCQSGELQRFGWLEHDGTSYGKQVLEDEKLNLRIQTTFVKDPARPEEAWHAQVHLEALNPAKNASRISLFLYLGVEAAASEGDLRFAPGTDGVPGDWSDIEEGSRQRSVTARVVGADPVAGPFVARISAQSAGPGAADSKLPKVRYVASAVAPESQEDVGQAQGGVWNAPKHLKSFVKQGKRDGPIGLPNKVDEGKTNWLATQFTFRPTEDGNLRVNLHSDFSQGSEETEIAALDSRLTELAAKASATFKTRINTVFPSVPSFNADKYNEAKQAAVASLLGGLGDFRGRLLVKSDAATDEADGSNLERAPEATLFSTVPSRSFFPRGFLWDEGFHGLLVARWQPRVFMDILGHWLGLQRPSGWIPREIPLGAEQEARVPPQFLPQEPGVANPPSLLLPLTWLCKTVVASNDEDLLLQLANSAGVASIDALRRVVLAFVAKALPRLAAWYSFLQASQRSKRSGCFRWAGRTAAHCLASGLDDYPRGLMVNEDECHLDLHSWMMFFASMLDSLCKQVSGSEYLTAGQEEMFCTRPNWSSRVSALNTSLFEIFAPKEKAAEEAGLLNDMLGKQPVSKKGAVVVQPPWRTDGRCGPEFPLTVNGRKVPGECDPYGGGPCCSPSGWCGGSPDFCACPGCKRALKLEERKGGQWSNLKDSHSPHVGYVSLFPFLFGLLPSDSIWEQRMVDLLDPSGSSGLSTPFGVPSLSTKDPLYGAGENYWRGKIWANINFLAISALERAAAGSGPLAEKAKRVHATVREQFVSTVVNAYHKQGYFFENFDSKTGQGTGAAPFTGWTTSVVLLMAGQGLGPSVLQPPGVEGLGGRSEPTPAEL